MIEEQIFWTLNPESTLHLLTDLQKAPSTSHDFGKESSHLNSEIYITFIYAKKIMSIKQCRTLFTYFFNVRYIVTSLSIVCSTVTLIISFICCIQG